MFRTEIKLNFYDCDPAGIIFYANLFKIAHSAYEEFLGSISPERNYFFDDQFVLPIIHAEADYKKPLKAFQIIHCEVRVEEVREKSFQLGYTFKVEKDIHAEATTVHVCVDKKTFVKEDLPNTLRERLKEESAG